MAYAFRLARSWARLRVSACLAIVLTILACAPEKTLEPVAEPQAVRPAVGLNTAVLTARGIAYGDFHLEEPSFRAPYSGTLRAISPTSATRVLKSAQAAGVRVFIALAVAKNLSADSKGRFDFAKWKKNVDRFRSIDLDPYIADGTIVGHYIIDEPQCKSCWGGERIPDSKIEELARYSKAIWPTMATGVRMVPSRLPNARQKHLDFAWAQWEGPHHVPSFEMTPERFRDLEIKAAKDRGIGVVFGLNYINGGDGSSDILGTYANARKVKRFAMSAAEVKRVGAVLAAAPYACALISWKSDEDFDRRPGMMEAKRHVSEVAAGRAPQTCAPALGSVTPPPETPPDPVPVPPTEPTPETPVDPVAESPGDRTPEPAPEPEPPPVNNPPSSGGNRAGIAFGEYLLGEARLAAPNTGAFRALTPTSARQFLDKARAAGVRVVIAMAAAKGQAASSRGGFDLAKWKKEIDRYRNVDLRSYIADGTLAGHYLISGPHCTSCWGGKAIPSSTLEEMARYSKSIWPNMATGIGAPPSRTANVRYRDVDFAWAQWEGPLHVPSNGMTPQRFRDVETAAAQQRGLKLVFGLNYLDGGDGSSRVAGTYKNASSKKVNRWQMSAEEVRRVGAVFAAAPYACAVLNRNATAAFDSRAGMREAKQYVANLAQNRAQQSCAR